MLWYIACIPLALQLLGFFYIPESPRWLMIQQKEDEAQQTLKKIYRNEYYESAFN